jgi:hypothetical protein
MARVSAKSTVVFGNWTIPGVLKRPQGDKNFGVSNETAAYTTYTAVNCSGVPDIMALILFGLLSHK